MSRALALSALLPAAGCAPADEDRLDDYVTSEPAIDYAASSILLLAAMQR